MNRKKRSFMKKEDLESSETHFTGERLSTKNNSRDAHLEGLSEDDKKLIKLMAKIFVNFVLSESEKQLPERF